MPVLRMIWGVVAWPFRVAWVNWLSTKRWARRWASFLGVLVRTGAGRIFTALVGTGVVATSFALSSDRNTVANTGVVVGSVLVVLGGMAPWLRRINWGTGSLDIESPELQSARVAQETAEEQDRDLVSIESSEVIDATRYYAASLAVDAILADATSLAPDCDFRVYLYDDEVGRLTTILRPDDEPPSRGWEVGQGVVGTAYKKGDYVLAAGPATHDGTHNLDADAQRRYRELTEVAAMPIANAGGKTIAVLAVSHTTGRTIIDTPEGFEDHLNAGNAIARILVDLLGWRADD